MVAEPIRQYRVAWAEGALLALAIFFILALGGESVRASYHGYLHTTVGEAVLRDGLLPENPYHAGSPLRYYTLYPTLGVLLGKIGIGPTMGICLPQHFGGVSFCAGIGFPLSFLSSSL